MIHLREIKQLDGLACRKSPNGKHWLVDHLVGRNYFDPRTGLVEKEKIILICGYCGVEINIESDPKPEAQLADIPF
jgi:hypothetical protein